jgi:hypothetical protein
MKKSLFVLAFALGLCASAQAQVQFKSGSAQLDHPVVTTKLTDADYRNRGRKHRVVTCRDGTRRIARVCRHRHGGVR